MKRFLPLFLLTILVGAGCTRGTSFSGYQLTEAPWPRTGSDLITKAILQDGPVVSATDAQTGRRFSSQLPASFTDGNGQYTTNHPGEKVEVQVAVGGTEENDLQQFLALKQLGQFGDVRVGSWHVTTAYDSTSNRWVARATQADTIDEQHMYHVIECLAAQDSDATFWDGCRTLIEHAMIDQGTAPTPSS